MPRKTTENSFQVQVDEAFEEIEDGDASNEESMLEMLSMLQEYQKRKAHKTSTRTTVFHNKKQSLYADARKNADAAVTEGVAYIEQYKKTIMELKAHETAEQETMHAISNIAGVLDDPVKATLTHFAVVSDKLSHKRAAEINEACGTIERHSTDRQLSRRRIFKDAKTEMDQQLEEQRVTTDASLLIKHYKSLLLA